MNLLWIPKSMIAYLGVIVSGLSLLLAADVGASFTCSGTGSCEELGGGCFQLASNKFEIGFLTEATPRDLTQSFAVDAVLNFGTDDVYGSGDIAFVISTEGTSNGEAKDSLIYLDSDNYFAVEIDTYYNPVFPGRPGPIDIVEDHVAIYSKASGVLRKDLEVLADPVPATSNGNVEDGSDYNFRVAWNADTGALHVYLEKVGKALLTPLISINLPVSTSPNVPSIAAGIGSDVGYFEFVGFTGYYKNTLTVCQPDIRSLLTECEYDCNKDFDCAPGLLCADKHEEELGRAGFDRNKANCNNAGGLRDDVCFDAAIIQGDMEECAYDCDFDSDCEGDLLCADEHKAELEAAGCDSRKADCGTAVGAPKLEVCFDPSLLDRTCL